jgi:uncharacterized OB-fold protein
VAAGIRPAVNRLNAPFWEAAARGVLLLPHCVVTGAAFWPPSPRSPFPGGRTVLWAEVPAFGTLESLVVYRRAFHPAFAPLMPYGIAQVALNCGPRLQVHVRDADAENAPRTGDRVGIGFRSLFDDAPPVPVVLPIP